MDIRELQRAFGVTPDGVAGKNTMTAIEAALETSGADPSHWSDARILVAAEQMYYSRARIDVGTVDGLVGEQTRHAREVWAARRANGNQPNPAVENWRDHQSLLDVEPQHQALASVNEARKRWPRQKDVMAFYGQPGTNQVMLKLPFPMRVAWEPSQNVFHFSCHTKVHDALGRIWKKTLDFYGYDRIRELRLDMFGGCLNVRKMRGGSNWSMHSWGIAEDVDPDRNQLKFTREQATLDNPEYEAFWKYVYDEGALSLGRERNYDWMHFQFTRDFS